MEFKVGDILIGDIIDFTHEGDGVLKSENFTIFVPRALIGDKMQVKIEEIKKNFAIGSIIKIIEPSKDRVINDFNIQNFGGGVPLIEYEYSKQLLWKREKVENDLKKIGGLHNVIVKDTLGMNNPYRYRNHVQIPVGIKDGKVVLGFYEKSTYDIVDMEGSILQPTIGDKIIKIIRQWIDKFKIEPYNKRTNKGVLRHIGLRFNKDNKVMVILVTATDNLPKKQELISMLTAEIEEVISIYHNINKLQSSPTYGRKYIKIYGEDSLVDSIGDFKFNISPNSFFQVNRTQAEVLYNKAIEYLDLNKDDIVFDLYCGIGTISLYIADKAKKVYGVEIVKEAIEDAKENALLNNINNVDFIVGKAEEVFPKLLKKGIRGNKVVVDPPRKGCEKEVLEAIVDLNPERIVYVSCNSATMARDVKYLVEQGYKVEEVQPVDMFPHTANCEVVCKLERK
jgi:23S rRNA (uracil1939-C5)-methyltransferase